VGEVRVVVLHTPVGMPVECSSNLDRRSDKMTFPCTARVLLIAMAAALGACGEATSQATPEHSPEACAVYMLVSGRTLDLARMGAYSVALQASGLYPKVGGYYVNRPRPIKVLEGSVPDDFVTLIVRFPNQAAVEEFWYSDAYQQDVLPLRINPSAGDYTVVVYSSAEHRDKLCEKQR